MAAVSLEKDFYTLKDLMERWQVSKETVMRLIRSMQIKSMKIGGQWRIPELEVRKYEKMCLEVTQQKIIDQTIL